MIVFVLVLMITKSHFIGPVQFTNIRPEVYTSIDLCEKTLDKNVERFEKEGYGIVVAECYPKTLIESKK